MAFLAYSMAFLQCAVILRRAHVSRPRRRLRRTESPPWPLTRPRERAPVGGGSAPGSGHTGALSPGRASRVVYQVKLTRSRERPPGADEARGPSPLRWPLAAMGEHLPVAPP